jgi:hypothetical protein
MSLKGASIKMRCTTKLIKKIEKDQEERSGL